MACVPAVLLLQRKAETDAGGKHLPILEGVVPRSMNLKQNLTLCPLASAYDRRFEGAMKTPHDGEVWFRNTSACVEKLEVKQRHGEAWAA